MRVAGSGDPLSHRVGMARQRVGFSAGAGPGHPDRDPLFERGDFLTREFFIGRHRHLVGVLDHLQQPALGGIPRHDDRAGVAAPQHCAAAVEP